MTEQTNVIATTDWWDEAVQMANDAARMTKLRHQVREAVVKPWRVIRTDEPIGLPSLNRFLANLDDAPPRDAVPQDEAPSEVCS